MKQTALTTIIFIFFSSALTSCSQGELYEFNRLAVQHNGRIKPMAAFAAEQIRAITGKERWKRQNPTVAMLHLLSNRAEAMREPLIRVSYSQLREQLQLPMERQYFSLHELAAKDSRLKQVTMQAAMHRSRGAPLSGVERHAELLRNQMYLADSLISGAALTVIPSSGAWQSPYNLSSEQSLEWQDLLDDFAKGRWADFIAKSHDWRQRLQPQQAFGRPLLLEAHYLDLHPLTLAWIAYLMAFCAFLFTGRSVRFAQIGLAFLALAFLLHSYGLLLRILVLGRPPVSNMYESMIFMNWLLVLLALVFAYRKRDLTVVSAAALISTLIMIYSSLLPIDASFDVLQPVLRSNYWLIMHVLTIVGSYSAFGLAAALAHYHLFSDIRGGLTPEKAVSSAKLIESTTQLGILLLGIGTVLGGIWANESWGRFWGWDPKETWSLITFLGYLIMIHLRRCGYLSDRALALSAILGFVLVLMTWYGVNFLLGQGLHSYGSASGGIEWVGAYLTAEIIFLGFVIQRA